MKELSKKELSKFEKNSKILENLKKELPFIDVEHKTRVETDIDFNMANDLKIIAKKNNMSRRKLISKIITTWYEERRELNGQI